MSTITLTEDAVRPRSRMRNEVLPLYVRMLRQWVRVPTTLIPPLFIPIFFLVINTQALGGITELPVFGTDDYTAFFLPVSIALSVASAGNGSGLSLVQDISNGFFDKLLIAPIARTSILISRLMVDGTRAALQAMIVLIVGLMLGANVATGVLGALGVVVMAFFFGLAFAGLGLNVALRTGSPEAAQAGFIIFFPLTFLAPSFVPMEFLPGWMEAVARVNPITYVLLGMRSLFLDGWVWSELLGAAVAIGGLGLLSLTMAFRALHVRAAQ